MSKSLKGSSIIIIWIFTNIRKLGDYQIPEQNQDKEDGEIKIETNS